MREGVFSPLITLPIHVLMIGAYPQNPSARMRVEGGWLFRKARPLIAPLVIRSRASALKDFNSSGLRAEGLDLRFRA